MSTNLLNLLSPDIKIEIFPDRFIFQRKDKILTLATKIFLSDDPRSPKVLGVGDGSDFSQPYMCIELFKDNEGGLPNISKGQCLDIYLKHAFSLITGKHTMIRPRVVFINSGCLSQLLCGFQESILWSAAVNAGARECVFEPHLFVCRT